MSGRIINYRCACCGLNGPPADQFPDRGNHDGFDLVDRGENIRKPADVRDLYQLLGTYNVLLNPKGEEMHVTHASPGVAHYYPKNGKVA
jgi:hypothetical protein